MSVHFFPNKTLLLVIQLLPMYSRILNSSAARTLIFGKFSGKYKLIMGHHYYQFLYCFQQHNYFSTVFLEECCADLQNSQKYISYFSIILLRYDIISIG